MATCQRPETIEQYRDWASDILKIEFDNTRTRNRYISNLQIAQNALQGTSFLRDLPGFLAEQERAYQVRTGSGLLMSPKFEVFVKPFESAVEKSFRINVLRNGQFPAAPEGGWRTPDNWYTKFDDLVRSTLVCKFLDGPKLLAAALDEYAKSSGFKGKHGQRNTDDGYYAFHHYTEIPVELLDEQWQSHYTGMKFELQLTTQLQEVLRGLTHPLYEKARLASSRRDDRWKWEHETPQFKTAYLGHTLHMIEAIMTQVRDSIQSRPEILNAKEQPEAET